MERVRRPTRAAQEVAPTLTPLAWFYAERDGKSEFPKASRVALAVWGGDEGTIRVEEVEGGSRHSGDDYRLQTAQCTVHPPEHLLL